MIQPGKDQNSEINTMLGGKYLLRRLLGHGGMGAVYEAENTFLRAPVAIKVVRPDVVHRDDALRRFVQEAQAAAQVRHANIVSVLDFGYDDAHDLLYIVQEFLEGTDLKRRLKASGPMAPREAIELLLPVMRALSHSHSKGVVHRDLKPDNIFLCDTPDGVVPKIIDFGIAKVLGDDGQSVQQTRTLLVMGTPLYMSPEQARGDRAVDHQTDIWQLGVVLYHMLSGRHPYEATTHNLVTAAIITQEPTRIETRLPNLAPDVAALVHRAIAKDTAERFQSMDAFWQAARSCSVMRDGVPALEASRVGITGSTSPSVPNVVPPTVDAATNAPQVVTIQPSQKRGGSLLLVLAIVVVVAIAAAFVAMRAMHSAPSSTTAVTETHLASTPANVVTEPPPVAPRPVIAEVDASAPAPVVQRVASPPIAPSHEPTQPSGVARAVRPNPSSRGDTERAARRPSNNSAPAPVLVY